MNHHLTVKELPESEKPYEKCLHYGAEYLSDAELLAVIVRTGMQGRNAIDVAHEILNCNGKSSTTKMSGRNYKTYDEGGPSP